MQIVSCPSCGAEVQFKSHAAVMAVCEFCRATVLKDADSVKDLGKMSSVLEDYTPIQIGTSGTIGARDFTVVGRIQLRYEQGMWNEWFILFSDSSTAWLGDSSGLYTVTQTQEREGPLPAFEDIVPGKVYPIGGEPFVASEKRNAECIAGQGELPFRVGEGWRIRVADFRSEAAFLTLDYSDGAIPKAYGGTAVTLAQMRCQLLRGEDQVRASASKYKGKLDALDCPSCGCNIKYLPGVTGNLVCPSCAAQLDATGPEAQVIAAGERIRRAAPTIALGATAMIDGQTYTVIGFMVRADEDGVKWTEYLLHNTRSTFFWLVETDDGWYRATVMSTWPVPAPLENPTAMVNNVRHKKRYDYDARVVFAAGAFNWRVAVGDVVRVYEFESSGITLAAELTADELTWSRSSRVAADQVNAWFKLEERKIESDSHKSTTFTFVLWLLGLNAIPLIFNFGATLAILVFAILAICLPVGFFGRRD